MERYVTKKIYFVKAGKNARKPTQGSKYAAGYDLYSAYDVIIPARSHAMVKTDLRIKLPHMTYGRIAPRSGLTLHFGLDVGAGIIDEDYRGIIGVVLFNHTDYDYSVGIGDRIAQLICERIYYPDFCQVEILDESERGEGCFGSSGLN